MSKNSRFTFALVEEVYQFLLSVDKTTIREIREKYDIGSNTTVYRCFSLIASIYNVTPVSEKGCCGGTYIDKADKNRVILSKDEQDAVSVVLDDKTQKLWIRREMFSVLYRIGNPKEARNVLDRNRYILAMDGDGPEHAG